jgi:L-lactate dehydrogenase (cytochrome)
MMKVGSETEGLVRRAKEARCSTLILGFDLHVRSQRHGEQKHGLIAPPRVDIPNIWDAATHPRWLFPMIRSRHHTFGNLIGLKKDAKNVPVTTKWLEHQYDPTLSIKDIQWARSVWPGKLLVKGVLHPEDAKRCVESGADGVIVSNHGGRQVDGAVSTIGILPAVVDAVKGKGTVLVDSGLRSGIDVLKMLARGADGCLIGRAYMYGLAAEGRKGVTKALEIIHAELDQNMALCGLSGFGALPKDLLVESDELLQRTSAHHYPLSPLSAPISML